MILEYKEEVWNTYQIFGYPDNIKEILKEKYNNNVWTMENEYPEMRVEMNECCIDYVYTDFDSLTIVEL